MDFDAFLKLFFLYTAVAFGGGLAVGKMLHGFTNWRTLLVFVTIIGAFIWGTCEVNGFSLAIVFVGWFILLVSAALGGFWSWALRCRDQAVAEEEAYASSPPPENAFDRNEGQIWIWSNQRFSH